MPLLNYAKETTNTSGAGTYTLAGAVSPFSSFVARAAEDIGGSSPWSQVFYVCTDNSGNWEFGDGLLTDAASDTITRSTIHASSNSGAAVNWPDTSAKDIYSWPPGSYVTGVVKQIVVSRITTDFSITATIPLDATIPTNTEGVQLASATITPTQAANQIRVNISIPVCEAATTPAVVSLFKDTTCFGAGTVATGQRSFNATWYLSAGSTASQTISIRAGDTGAGTFYVNRDASTANLFSTEAEISLFVEEIEIV
jgi:hypothetical protein